MSPPLPQMVDPVATEMTSVATTPIRNRGPPSPMNSAIMRTPSSPSTVTTTATEQHNQHPTVHGTPASSLSIPNLYVDDSYFDESDLLGLGELSMSADDDDRTEPSTGDDSNNKYIVHISKDKVTTEEDTIYNNVKGLRPIIYSYLRKLGRNGKWQRRFFECDGQCLTYFKTKKRKIQLATLDLAKVGSIAMSEEDKTGCTFHIQVADRPYSLRAESESMCVDWIITLNRVKEARMNIGRVKLVTPRFLPALKMSKPRPMDEKDDPMNDAAPRVVLMANRPRTHCADSTQWQDSIATGTSATTESTSSPTRQNTQMAFNSLTPENRQDLAVWEKPPPYKRIRDKLLQWARSIKKVAVKSMTGCRSSQQEFVISNTSQNNDQQRMSEASNPRLSSIDTSPQSPHPSKALSDDSQSTTKNNSTNIILNKPKLIPPHDDGGEARHLT